MLERAWTIYSGVALWNGFLGSRVTRSVGPDWNPCESARLSSMTNLVRPGATARVGFE